MSLWFVSSKGFADGGIAPELRKDGKYWVVQCKKWTGENVGVDKVQRLLGAQQREKADGSIIVSTSGFTEPAEKFAYETGIELIDNARLWELVQAARAEDHVQELAAPTHALKTIPSRSDGNPGPTVRSGFHPTPTPSAEGATLPPQA